MNGRRICDRNEIGPSKLLGPNHNNLRSGKESNMTSTKQNRNRFFGISLRATTAAMAIALVLMVVATESAQAQTYQVIYNFTGGQDGANPGAGLTIDRGGNFYGTAVNGGVGNGTVFKLSYKGSGWIFTPLYDFAGGDDGAAPYARVIFGLDGSLYGTTESGGGVGGTVFNLKPQPTACKTALCPWVETLLYRFNDPSDGSNPSAEVAFDQAGNLYSTTPDGGLSDCGILGCGVVFELTSSGGGWTFSAPYTFTNGETGPTAGVILDKAGNLYGSDAGGGDNGNGTVYELTPSGSGWTENTLYNFQSGSDGRRPTGGVIFDQSGNLYGTTEFGGWGGGGTVFKLTPSGGSWTYSLVYSFTGSRGPLGSLAM